MFAVLPHVSAKQRAGDFRKEAVGCRLSRVMAARGPLFMGYFFCGADFKFFKFMAGF